MIVRARLGRIIDNRGGCEYRNIRLTKQLEASAALARVVKSSTRLLLTRAEFFFNIHLAARLALTSSHSETETAVSESAHERASYEFLDPQQLAA
jgi:hypothetical protein